MDGEQSRLFLRLSSRHLNLSRRKLFKGMEVSLSLCLLAHRKFIEPTAARILLEKQEAKA